MERDIKGGNLCEFVLFTETNLEHLSNGCTIVNKKNKNANEKVSNLGMNGCTSSLLPPKLINF